METGDRKPDIGALWLKRGRKGEYMTGTINGERVVLFPVDNKSERSPDWRVYKSEPREAQAKPQSSSEPDWP